MKKKLINKKKDIPTSSIEEIEAAAESGEDTTHFYKNPKRVSGDNEIVVEKKSIKRVLVDFPERMLEELDQTAQDLYISRQAVIKMLIRHSLNSKIFTTKKAG